MVASPVDEELQELPAAFCSSAIEFDKFVLGNCVHHSHVTAFVGRLAVHNIIVVSRLPIGVESQGLKTRMLISSAKHNTTKLD